MSDRIQVSSGKIDEKILQGLARQKEMDEEIKKMVEGMFIIVKQKESAKLTITIEGQIQKIQPSHITLKTRCGYIETINKYDLITRKCRIQKVS